MTWVLCHCFRSWISHFDIIPEEEDFLGFSSSWGFALVGSLIFYVLSFVIDIFCILVIAFCILLIA